MRRLMIGLIAVPVVAIAATSGLLLARRLGSAAGTTADPTEPAIATVGCPPRHPGDCRDLIARTLHVAGSELPIITDAPGLSFQRGQIIVPKNGKPPVVALQFEATSRRAYQLLISPVPAPVNDKRSIGTTPRGRKYRTARGDLSSTYLVFYDQHFQYAVIGNGFDPELDKHPGALALAQQLVDAVHLSTRQADPS